MKRRKKVNISLNTKAIDFLEKQRVLLISGIIDNDLSKDIISKLLMLNRLNRKKTINIIINSPGGSVIDGLAIIDTFRSIHNPIRTVIIGYAASTAALISVSADERVMTSNSYWMQHPMSSWINDYFSFIKDRVCFEDSLYNQVLSILEKYTKLTKKDFQKIKNGELWLNSKDALKKGVVDKII